jgi:hypothetical protein
MSLRELENYFSNDRPGKTHVIVLKQLIEAFPFPGPT